MKIKKKTLYIVLPLSILVVLLLLLFVFLMGWFGNTPKLNRYDSLMEICEVEKKFLKVLVRCDALIYKTEERDGKNCLDLIVINKENTNILPLEVCEKEKILDTSNPVLDTDMKVPMHMVFEYTYLPPLSYGISNISMELMEDKEISTLIVALNKVDINLFNIRFQHLVDTEERGYSYYESDRFVEGMKLGVITFVHTKVNTISVENNEIVLNVSISVNGVMRETQIRVREFEYLTNISLSEPVSITTKNISDVDMSKAHALIFLYIPNGVDVNIDGIISSCGGNEVVWKSLCDNKDDLERFVLDKPIEEYIKESFEKLMFSTLFANE